MIGSLLLGAMLSLGQSPAPNPGAVKGDFAPMPAPQQFALQQPVPRPVEEQALQLNAPLIEAAKEPEPPSETAPGAAPDRWLLQRLYQGTGPGIFLDTERMLIYGWFEASYSASSAANNAIPLTWNDRANEFLFQQCWVHMERTLVTSGTEPSFGYRVDMLAGSDYRYSLQRGMLNDQLLNPKGVQSLYGADLPVFYAAAYVPTICRGTEFRLGRQYTPFGTEGFEAPNTPLLSRSYAFNWCPPFTHMGATMINNLTSQWQVLSMLAAGNDVFLDGRFMEARYVNRIQYTSIDKRDLVAFGSSIGRGKMNTGQPFAPPTVATINEPAGRNNINVFDLTWAHTFTPRFAYGFEAIYGYQSGVPANVVGGLIDAGKAPGEPGMAHWGSIVNYLFFNWTPAMGTILRLELFDDFEGARTGFEGLYTSFTAGMQFKLWRHATGIPQLLIRPELRYDNNGYSLPFEGGKHDLFTAAGDVILRW